MRYLLLLLLFVGCSTSVVELQAKRTELLNTQAALFHEVYVLEEFLSHDYERMGLVVREVSRIAEEGQDREQLLKDKRAELEKVNAKIQNLTDEIAALAIQ